MSCLCPMTSFRSPKSQPTFRDARGTMEVVSPFQIHHRSPLRACTTRWALLLRPRILDERGYFNHPCRSVDGFRRCWFVPIAHPRGTTAIFTDRMTVPSLPRRVTLRGSAPVLTDNDSRMCGSPTTLCYVEACALSEMDGYRERCGLANRLENVPSTSRNAHGCVFLGAT